MEDILTILNKCSDAYYNDGVFYELNEDEKESIYHKLNIETEQTVSDGMFDIIVKEFENKYGTKYTYLGSIPENTLNKEKLPFVMGSMTQIQEGELHKWINPLWMYCCSVKLDGCSVGLVYNHGKLEKAYTRGNGYEGMDITNTVKRFGKHFPKTIEYDGELLIRGEIIVPKCDIQSMIKELEEENGKIYKNGRNSVAGALNSKIAPKSFIKYAHLVCYHIEGNFVRESFIFETLEHLGFEVPLWYVSKPEEMNEEKLIKDNIEYKNSYKYETDGLIITQNLRNEKGYDTGTINPKCSRKYKVGCVDNYAETEVININWQISAFGYLKPIVEFNPVELDGSEVSFATGNNYNNIITRKISIGSTIKVHKSGLIIPFIDEVVEHAEVEDYNLPNLSNFEINGVDLVLLPMRYDRGEEWFKFYNEMLFQKTLYFCQKMNIEFAGEGNLRKVLNVDTLINSYSPNPGVYRLLSLAENYFVEKIGVNGSKLYNSLKKSLQNINACQFYDAVSCFGRGIGEKRLQSLFDKHKTLSLDYEQVINVDGFGKNIAKQFIDNQDKYLFWKQYIENNDLYSFAEIKSPDSSSLSNLNVLFTGIRDKEMENFIKNNGGNICSSFNKDVNLLITKDIEGNSSKLKKAKENNVKILNYNETMEFLKNMVKTTSD